MILRDLAPERQSELLAGHDPTTPSGLRALARALREPLSGVSRRSGIPYVRLERVLNGRAIARPDELSAIASAIGVETHP